MQSWGREKGRWGAERIWRVEEGWFANLGEVVCLWKLGESAVGTGLNTPEGYALEVAITISELTNLPFISAKNKFESLAANDAIVETHGAIKQLA